MATPTKRDDPFRLVRVVSDVVCVSAAWIIAYYLRFSTWIESPKGIPDPSVYIKLIPFIAVIWLGVLSSNGFLRRSGRHRSAFTEALDIIQSHSLAVLAFIAFTYFYEEYRYSRVTIVIFAVLSPIFAITARSMIRKVLRRRRRNVPPKKTLIVASVDLLQEAITVALSDSHEPYKIERIVTVGESGQLPANLPVAPTTEPKDWQKFLIEEGIQKVVIAARNRDYSWLDQNLDAITEQVSDVQMIPDLFRYTRFSAGLENVRGVPVINVHSSPLDTTGQVLKRLLDITGSLAGLLLVSPVMITCAVLVKLTSRGPIFYRQERMGIDGRPFQMLKFRSMPIDAENKTGAVWATATDDRATFIGRIMRRTSIDELPQLFNIFNGDMSLVGPRPERPVFVQDFRKKIPGYMLRHKVKAGLTGWAQVNGWRGNTSLEKRIECDLYYIQNWSFKLDVKILILTVFKIFTDKNAY
jgi:Undecaprenyl-phosphate glucose phosphotransferase